MNEPLVTVFATEATPIATDPWTLPYWEGGKADELRIARCTQCGTFRMPPLPFCAHCHSQGVEWVKSDGRAELYSYTVCPMKEKPGEPRKIFIPVVVEIPDAGRVRLTGNLVDVRPAELRIGMALQTHWLPIADGWKFPVFRPA